MLVSKTVLREKSLFDKPEIMFFDIFGEQLNTFMSVGILVKNFRCKLLKFGWWNKTVLNA